MIYLVTMMAFYLLVSAALGGAVGWLLMRYLAGRQLGAVRRELHDTRARLPALENSGRQLTSQVKKLKKALQARDDQLAERQRAAADATGQAVAEHGQVATGKLTAIEDTAAVDALESELLQARSRISDLETALAAAKAAASRVTEQEDGPVATNAAAESDREAAAEVKTLQAELRQRVLTCQSLEQQLAREQRRTVELERERELQKTALEVLNQQLEAMRERSADATVEQSAGSTTSS